MAMEQTPFSPSPLSRSSSFGLDGNFGYNGDLSIPGTPASPGAAGMLQAYRAKHIIQQVVDKVSSLNRDERIVGAQQVEKLSTEHPEIQNMFRESGAMTHLVPMLRLSLPEAEAAVRAVINLVVNNHENKEALRMEGGIPYLVTLCHLKPDNSVTRYAAWAVGVAAANNPGNQHAIRTCGGIPPLVKLLDRGVDDKVATEAAIALKYLSYSIQTHRTSYLSNPENQDAIRDARGLEALVQIIKDQRSDETVLQAVWALNCLAAENVANKEAIMAASSLKHIVGLLKVK